MGKKRPGRRKQTPEKLTEATQKVIVESTAAGVPQKYAALRAGVTDRAVRAWVAKGKRDRAGPYRSFYSAMKKAEADRLAASVARIGRAAQGGQVVERTSVTTTKTHRDGTSTTTTKTFEKVAPGQWTADAWYLERRHEDDFGSNRGEIRELRKELAALAKAVAGGHANGKEDEAAGGATGPGGVRPKVGGDARGDTV